MQLWLWWGGIHMITVLQGYKTAFYCFLDSMGRDSGLAL